MNHDDSESVHRLHTGSNVHRPLSDPTPPSEPIDFPILGVLDALTFQEVRLCEVLRNIQRVQNDDIITVLVGGVEQPLLAFTENRAEKLERVRLLVHTDYVEPLVGDYTNSGPFGVQDQALLEVGEPRDGPRKIGLATSWLAVHSQKFWLRCLRGLR